MRVKQSHALTPELKNQSRKIGELLARLRIARRVSQSDAALRAGISRNTAYRLEKGDPGLALGQVLRYLEAIAPGKTIQSLLNEDDPSLAALELRERKHRVRELSKAELNALNF